MSQEVESKKTSKQEAQFVLISRGKEPFRAFRFRFGSTQTVELQTILKMRVQQTINAQKSPTFHFPKLELDTTNRLQRVLGQNKVHTRIQKVKVHQDKKSNPYMISKIEKSWKKLNKVQFDAFFSEKGTLQKIQYLRGKAKESTSNVEQMVHSWFVQFPTQSIGLGALWEVRHPLPQPVIGFQIMRFRLVKWDKNRVEIQFEMSSTYQPYAYKNKSKGYEMKILKFLIAGKGKASYQLDSMVHRYESQLSKTWSIEQVFRGKLMSRTTRTFIDTVTLQKNPSDKVKKKNENTK